MARVRGEFILMGGGATVFAANVIREVIGTFSLDVTASATAGGDRPQCPNTYDDGQLYVRLTAIEGPVYAAWGNDPTATGSLQENEMRLVLEMPDAIAIKGGQRLSFIEGV